MTNAAPAKKKGLSTFAWIAIGCGGLIVVCFIAVFGLGLFAVKKGKEMVAEATGSESFEEFVQDMQDNPAKKAAEAMIALNPELELVATDDEAGTVTFTNTKTGETATMNFEDIAEGRWSMTTDEGEFKVDAQSGEEGGVTLTGPDGAETRYGGSTDLDDVPDWVPLYPRASSTESTYSSQTRETVNGLVTAQTGDTAQRVIDHYKKELEDAGWTIDGQSMSSSGGTAVGTVMASRDGRSVNVGATERGGECQVTINYSGTSR